MEERKLVSIECHEYFKALRRATGFNIERSNTLLVANEEAIKAATDNFTNYGLVSSFIDSDAYRDAKANGGVLVSFLRYIGLDDLRKGARQPRNASAVPASVPSVPAMTTADDSDNSATAAAFLAKAMELLKGGASVDAEQVRAIVAEEVRKVADGLVIKHEIKVADAEPAKVDGLVCDRFDDILSCVANGFNVYLVGPSGTGKSYTADQVAAALHRTAGETYFPVAKVSYAEQLTGYMNAAGVYVEGVLYKAMKAGALLFVDEIDASDPNALVALNAAIASRSYTFPNCEYVKAADGFCIMAAGNTYGNGADNLYTGRNAIDASTLDRMATFYIDYNERVELASANGNRELVDFIHEVRKAAKAQAVDFVCSYRALKMVATMEAAGMNTVDLMASCVVKGMDKEDARRLFASVDSSNKYGAAAKKAAAKIA